MSHFTENDPRVQDYLDDCLPAAERSAIERHLAGCPDCAALCRQYRRLDRQLARTIHRPSLSPGFRARVLDHLGTESTRTPAGPLQRHQLEQQLAAEWQAQRRHFLRAQLPSFLDGLGYSAAAAIGGTLLFRLIMLLLHTSGTASHAHGNYLQLGIAAATGALILLVALAIVAKTHLARWLADF